MSLLFPSKKDYETVASEIIETAAQSGLEAVVYGSFIKGSFKPGLSDIDALVYSHADRWMFPPQYQEIFDGVSERAHALLIPLQLSWVTKKSLAPNAFFTKDPGYLAEVRRGVNSPYKTHQIASILTQKTSSAKEHDRAMLRFFHIKLQRLGAMLPAIKRIAMKHDAQITTDEQRTLQEAWDIVKKGVHIASLLRRIQRKPAVFHEKDLAEIHPEWFGEYIDLLHKVQSMQDWILLLREPYSREKLEGILSRDFEILILSVESALGSKK